MALAWTQIAGSTLVSAAAYDPAAERIYVRFHSGTVHYYDDCPPHEWLLFVAPTTGKGGYVDNVLSRKKYQGRLGGPPSAESGLTVARSFLLNVFRPAERMSDPNYFAGRREEIRQLVDALHVVGSCLLIYGERGLGKSSLALQAEAIARGDSTLLDNLRMPDRAFRPGECFSTVSIALTRSTETTDSVLQTLVNVVERATPRDASAGSTSRRVGYERSAKASLKIMQVSTTSRYETVPTPEGSTESTPEERLADAADALVDAFDQPVLLIIDELDRLADKAGLASAIRALTSDRVKFMLVGIAHDWADLLDDHASLARQLRPVRVPRMRRPELVEIIDLAGAALDGAKAGLRFDDDARERIVTIAGGYPWFVHVLGQAALMLTAESGRSVVGAAAVSAVLRDFVDNAYAEQYHQAYKKAVGRSRHRETVLRVLASSPEHEIATNSTYAQMRRLGVVDPAEYRSQLASDRYGAPLTSHRQETAGHVRFRDAMFKIYVSLVPPLFPDVPRAPDDGG